MYPGMFSVFGLLTERLVIVTKEMKFFFKLLENVLKDRLESKQVNYLRQPNRLVFYIDEKLLRRIEIQRLYWIGWRSNFRIHERSRWQNGAHVDSWDYRWDHNGTGKYTLNYLCKKFSHYKLRMIFSRHSSCWPDSTQQPQLWLVPASSWPEIRIFKKNCTKASQRKWKTM